MGKEQQQRATEIEVLTRSKDNTATLDLGADAQARAYDNDCSDDSDDECEYHDAREGRARRARRSAVTSDLLMLSRLAAGGALVCFLTLWIVFMCLYISDQSKLSAIESVVSIDIACACECRYADDDLQQETCFVHWRCEDAMYGVIKGGSTRDRAYVRTFNSLVEFYRSANDITRELIANEHHSTFVHQEEDVSECAAAFGLANAGDGYVNLTSTDGREVVNEAMA